MSCDATWIRRTAALAVATMLAGLPAARAQLPMTMRDFHVPGTQVGDVSAGTFSRSDNCRICHGDFDSDNEPSATWSGSLMGLAGRDPLFYAQMTTANQDVANVGYYCLRCHVPMSIVTGHANQPSGDTMDADDRDGVNFPVARLTKSMIGAPTA